MDTLLIGSVANAYGYCLKQLKYPDTDKALFVKAVEDMRRNFARV